MTPSRPDARHRRRALAAAAFMACMGMSAARLHAAPLPPSPQDLAGDLVIMQPGTLASGEGQGYGGGQPPRAQHARVQAVHGHGNAHGGGRASPQRVSYRTVQRASSVPVRPAAQPSAPSGQPAAVLTFEPAGAPDWTVPARTQTRQAPSPGSAVAGWLPVGAKVPLLGKVAGSDWYAISSEGLPAFVQIRGGPGAVADLCPLDPLPQASTQAPATPSVRAY